MTSHLLLFVVYSFLLASPALANESTTIHKHSSAVFPDKETAIEKLTERDQFVEAMSRFDRQSRLQSDTDVTIEAYLEFVSQHVLDWNDDEIKLVKSVLTSLEEKFRPYQLPFPEHVLFVKTDGKEEGGAAYCRRNMVVLPAPRVAVSRERLERLIIHELFHVLSSHNPKLRQKLYSIIQFETGAEIPLPSSLAERKLTNPDAPLVNSVISLTHNEKEITVTPILFSKVEKYESTLGGPFFKFLEFKLMVVVQDESQWKPLLVDDAPVLLSPGKTPDYIKRIGNNTGYIIHPDEILADNFVHLILQAKDLETPHIVTQMGALLTDSGTE